MRRSVIRRIVDTLRDDELLALLGIAQLLRDQSYTIFNHAFKEYKKLCRDYSVIPHGKASLRKYISQFIHLDLIRRNKIKHERSLEITLLDIPSIVLIGLVHKKLKKKLNLRKRVYVELKSFKLTSSI